MAAQKIGPSSMISAVLPFDFNTVLCIGSFILWSFYA